MNRRAFGTTAFAAVCAAAAPTGPPFDPPPAPESADPGGRLPTPDEFVTLLECDPAAALDAAARRAKAEAGEFTAVMRKQERLAGTVGPVELVRVAFRQSPLAVFMVWEQGATKLRSPVRTLYVRGENGGKTKAKLKLGLTLDVSPDDASAKAASRYCIEDFGFGVAARRTATAWAHAKSRGQLQVKYRGVEKFAECGDVPCHVLERTCDPPDVDNYRADDATARDPAKSPQEAFVRVTVLLNAATWLQVGSVLSHADGGLVGSYHFRDVNLKPHFDPKQFTPAALNG